MRDDTLVRMANQIADFFAPYPEDEAVAGVADHMKKFWDPRMRAGMFAALDRVKGDLRPLAVKAIERLRDASASAN